MTSKKVYIAADGFLSFIDRANPKHVHVSAIFRYFAQEKYQLFTSYAVLEETYNEIYNKISPSLAKDFSVLVIDGGRGLGNSRVFPAGPLRAPLDAQLARADAVVQVIAPILTEAAADSELHHAIRARAHCAAVPERHLGR